MRLTALEALIDELRLAERGAGSASDALRVSTVRVVAEPSYRRALQDDIHQLLVSTNSTHWLTEAAILSDEPIVSGVIRRVVSKVAPAPPRGAGLDPALSELVGPRDGRLLDDLDALDILAWVEAILEDYEWRERRSELSASLVILATRVAGAGMDARLAERLPSLEEWGSPFLDLSRVVDSFAAAYEADDPDLDSLRDAAQTAVTRSLARVVAFRSEKEKLGTTLHLSSSSLRMLQQLRRLRLLIESTDPKTRSEALTTLGVELLVDKCRSRPTLHFMEEKLELISYLAIGHAAQKGSKYAVHTPGEFRSFWLKSLLGGVIVAFFATFKLHLGFDGLALLPQAFVYGLNYALCFVVIYVAGATLATKQPALTASRLAESLEARAGRNDFPHLVRAIWRSQFVSFLGNVGGAASVALLLSLVFRAATGTPIVDSDKALYLADSLNLMTSGTAFYAAVAGVMLSLAGFIAGFVDNAVVFHRVPDRVRAGSGIFRLLPEKPRHALAKYMTKSSGGVAGNVVLGFMLGSAGTLGVMWGVPIDIRHIAFASSHGAMALFHSPEVLTVNLVAMIVAAVAVVGFVNFIVSFSLTLAVAVSARRLEGVKWWTQLGAVWQLVKSNPLAFFIPLSAESAEQEKSA